ncbi:MAG TPA: ABC transporter substrate-binding protein, partial [Candidatus Acidoferrales bacterium]|nr:ABC transporter substrate-binding protein [Candidatus Acidoferrales bacterium]
MRRISSARCTTSSLLFALLFVALSASAARRPRYGGTLAIDFQARVTSLDPAQKQGSVADRIAQERLLDLVADRLVELDQFGQPKPALAISWRHNDKFMRWEFQIRPNIKFQDATPLTPQLVVDSLQAVNPAWRVSSADDSVIVESDSALPALPYILAESQNSILLRKPTGEIIGTGPFRLSTWEPAKHVVFAA